MKMSSLRDLLGPPFHLETFAGHLFLFMFKEGEKI